MDFTRHCGHFERIIMTLTIEEAGTTAFPIQGESLYLRALKDFSAGWVGGLAQVLSGQPFDTIKVRLQTQPSGLDSLAKPGVPRYTGALDCALQTLRSEGLAGFYRVSHPSPPPKAQRHIFICVV